MTLSRPSVLFIGWSRKSYTLKKFQLGRILRRDFSGATFPENSSQVTLLGQRSGRHFDHTNLGLIDAPTHEGSLAPPRSLKARASTGFSVLKSMASGQIRNWQFHFLRQRVF